MECPTTAGETWLRRCNTAVSLGSALTIGITALSLAAASATGTANAQEATPPPPAAKVEKKVEPIPITEIGVRSERAKREIAEISADLTPHESVEQVTMVAPQLRKSVKSQIEESKHVREGSASVLALDGLKAGWKKINDQLDTLQNTLGARGSEVENDIKKVQAHLEVWKATHADAVQNEVADDVLTQISDVERIAEAALAQARKRQSAILALQSDVASLTEESVTDLKNIDELRDQAVQEVFSQDQSPVWSREFWHILHADEIAARMGEENERDIRAIKAFWNSRHEIVFVYLGITAALVLLMLSARNRIRTIFDEEGEELAGVRAVFESPIALTLLTAFFIASIWAADSGDVVGPILRVLNLLPAVVILRRIIDRSLYPVLNGLVVVFVLEHVREIFLPLPVLPRLLFMAEMATILTLSAFWLRPGRARQIPRELADRASIRIIAIGLRLSLAFAAIALFAEAAGFGALAYLIGKTLIFAGYAAVVLYGLARVLDGLFSFLLRIRPLRLLGSVRRNRALIQRRLILLIHVAGWYIWFSATLRRAELQDDVWGYFDRLIAAELPLPEVAITVGDIIACGLTFYAATLLSRFVRFSLEEEVYTRVRLPTGRTSGISTLIHYTILTMGLILAATALGFDANRFTLLAGAFGVGIGFGLQTIVNNFISGIILLTERPVEVGHTVELAEVFGEVTRIGIRSSTVRTWQGAEVIVPNADLISQQVTNWTLSDRRRRMEIPVGVDYGSDPKLVIETLVTAALIDDRVLRFPEPYVLFMGFGDSSLDFELRAWTDDFDSFMRVRSAVCVAIVDALQAAGLRIPFPQRDLHVKTVVEQAGRSPREQEQPVPRTGPESAPGSGTEQLDSEATRGDRRVG